MGSTALNFTLSHTTRTYPTLPFLELKNDILNARYALSLVFVGRARAKALNIAHRKKEYVPNVLSFSLDESAGEIYICLDVAKKQAHERNMKYETYVAYLFIHGLLHLKGHLHGDTMEQAETKTLRKHGLL